MYSLKGKLFDLVGPPEGDNQDSEGVIFFVKAVDTTGLPDGHSHYATFRKVLFKANPNFEGLDAIFYPDAVDQLRYATFILTGDNMTNMDIDYFDEHIDAHDHLVNHFYRAGAIARHVEKPEWWPWGGNRVDV